MKFMKLFQDQFARPRPQSILYNKYLLYFVMFVAIGNLFSGLMNSQYIFASYFVLIGFVLSFFSKNMIVILVLTVALSNIMKVLFVGTALEGYEGQTESKPKVTPAAEAPVAEKKPAESKDKTAESKEKKSELVDSLKADAKELLSAQKSIIQGFQEIEPYMKQAETLIGEIDETTKKLKEVNSMK